MPIYEYRCKTCGGRMEAMVKSFNDSLGCMKCSECGETAERVLSRFSFRMPVDYSQMAPNQADLELNEQGFPDIVDELKRSGEIQ